MPRVGGGANAAAIALGIAALSFHAFPPKTALVSCVLGWVMLTIAAIDARCFTIPDVLSLPAIVLGLLASGSMLDPSRSQLVSVDHAIGAFLGGAALWLVREAYARLRGWHGLGLGDVKLAAAGGAWTGWDNLADVILLAAAGALIFAIVRATIRRESLSGTQRVAFGAFLAPSIWVVWSLSELARGLH
jgi:leader peptidase (prepilin peptidase)/N-methyltransferase